MASLVKNYSKEKLTGQIFTPFFIVDKILDDIGYNSSEILKKKIIDPACGDGRFLIKIVERIIKYSHSNELEENLSYVYGWDIDSEAIEIAKNKLNLIIKQYNIDVRWNIKVENSIYKGLEQNNLFSVVTVVEKFDYVVGNPPYIRVQHLEKQERSFIQNNYKFCKTGSTDIYIAFYELALNLLRDNGICGYITPNTFFHTDTANNLRKYFEMKQNIKQITNYGHIQLFDDATTYSAITIFDKKKKSEFLYQHADNKTKFQERFISFDEIKDQKFWQLSIEKNKKIKGKRLGDIADIHVGVTTLADKLFIMPIVKIENQYISLQSKTNGEIKIEKGILKPIIKVSTLKNPNEFIKEYIIFPYKKINNKQYIIKEDELKEKYPLAYKYLLSIKKILDQRDNGKLNSVAWYAYGRSQGLETSFGKKILFSPMNKEPNFMYSSNEEATFYSGYCIKYSGNIDDLLVQINSKRMETYIKNTARDFRGGWKSYNKKIVQEFIIEEDKDNNNEIQHFDSNL